MSQYQNIKKIEELRYKEISEMVHPFLSMTDGYGAFISDIVEILGQTPPKSVQDKVVRDLTADIFDFLFEAHRLVITGKIAVAFPLARRAFESTCLLSAFIQNSEMAEKWTKGKEFSNSEMRKYLSASTFKEDASELKELYKFYSSGTHPNRELIPSRYLGEGNLYTLGVIGVPDLILITKHLIEITHLWFWFGATVAFHHKEILHRHDSELFKTYKKISTEAQDVKSQLAREFNRLLEAEQA